MTDCPAVSSPIPVIHAPAEVTAETVADIRSMATPHLEGTAAGLVVDLSGVTMITSAGLGLFVDLGQRLSERGAVLALARANRRVNKLIGLVGLDAVMRQFHTVEEAQAFVLESHAG